MKILRCKEIENKISLKKSTIYAMIQNGLFPGPIKLNQKSVGWIESEVDEWLNQRAMERDSTLTF